MNSAMELLVLIACLGISFLCSGMEAGVFALNRLRIRHLARGGDLRARFLAEFLERSEDFLWTIFVGNSLSTLVAAGLSVLWLDRWVGTLPGLLWLLVALIAFLFYTLFELLPKMLFRTYPNRLCLMTVTPFRGIRFALWPLVALIRWAANQSSRWDGGRRWTGRLFGNREEMRQVLQDSSTGLSSDEKTMISRVLDLEATTVGRLAIPIESSVAVAITTPMAEVMALLNEKGMTRLPVWQEDTPGPGRRIVGILSLRRSLYAGEIDLAKTAGDYLKPAIYLEEDLRLENALRRMQQSGERLAIVLSRDRREVGIIGLEDLLRALFGELKL